jgi:acyl carrier protein
MRINSKELDIKLEKILKKVFKIEKINLEGSIEDISEWDSFAHFQLMDEIEVEFKIEIEPNDVIIMTSIPIIKKKIMNYLS